MPDHPEEMLMEKLREKMSDSMQRGFDRHYLALNDVYPGTLASFNDYIFRKYTPPLSIEFMEEKILALRLRKGENPMDVYDAYLDGIDLYEQCRVLINGRMQHAQDHIPAFSIHAKFVHLRKIFIDNNDSATYKNKCLINSRMRKVFTRARPNNYAAIVAVIEDNLKAKIKPICDAANKDLTFISYKSEPKIRLFENGNLRNGRDEVKDREFKGDKYTPFDGYVCDACNIPGHWKKHCPKKGHLKGGDNKRGRGGRNGGRGSYSGRGGHRGGNGRGGGGRKRGREKMFDPNNCYRCGKPNHIRRDCRAKADINGVSLGAADKRQKTGDSQVDSSKLCHRCGRDNHFLVDCRAYFHFKGHRLKPLEGRNESGRGNGRGRGGRGGGKGGRTGWRGRGGRGGGGNGNGNNYHNTNHNLHITHEFGIPPQQSAAQRPQPPTAVRQFAQRGRGQFASRSG